MSADGEGTNVEPIRTGNRVYALNMVTLDRKLGPFDGDFAAGLSTLLRQVSERLASFTSATRCLHKHPASEANRPCQQPDLAPHWQWDQAGEAPPSFAPSGLPLICPEKVKVGLGLMLGKGDLCIFTSCSDEIWAAHVRAALHTLEGVAEVLPVPFLRLVQAHQRNPTVPPSTAHCSQKGGAALARDGAFRDRSIFSERDPLPALVCFTTARLRRTLGGAPAALTPRAKERADQGATSQQIAAFRDLLEALQREEELDAAEIEGFLTFNDYEVVLTFQADTYEQAYRRLDIIRQRGALVLQSTSTQICLPLATPADIAGWGCGPAGEDPEAIAQRRGKRLDLLRARQAREHAQDAPPAWYVGLLLRVEAEAPDPDHPPIAQQILDLLATEGFIDGRADLQLDRHGYWDLHIVLRCVDLRDFVHFVVDRIAGFPGVLGTRIVPYLDVPFSGRVGVFPTRAPAADVKALDPVPRRLKKWDIWGLTTPADLLAGDLLHRRQHDLEAHIGWICTRVAQFCEAWEAHRDVLPHNVSIWRLQQLLASARIALQVALTPRRPADWLIRQLRQAEAIDHIARLLPDYEALVGFYNEHLEAVQAAAVVEPFPRVGERAGALTLIMTAINRLMKDCCGLAWLDAPFLDNTAPRLGAGYEDRCRTRRWLGLCTSTAGRDFLVNVQCQILMVPAVTKLSARGLLLSLPHEAAHFVIDSLLPRSTPDHGGDEDLDEVWKRIARVTNEHLKAVVAEGKLDHWVEATLRSQPYRELLASELLADLMAYFIGGPAFAVGFDSYRYQPFTFQRARWAVLPAFQRVRMGSLLARRGTWRTERDNMQGDLDGDPTWERLVASVHDQMETVENTARAAAEEIVTSRRAPEGIDESVARIWPQEQRIKDAIGRALDELLPKVPDEDDIAETTKRVLRRHFDARCSPLFFHDSENAPTEKLKKVLQIRDRLLHGWEIVTDARPRDLIAAGAFLQRPHQFDRRNTFPTLRLYMSLLFTELDVEVAARDPRYRPSSTSTSIR
ncbi:MAG: hypothetical protein ABIO70_29080 [Pseudomonadota bacterium]